ncbi:hypothetical protein RI049_21590 [Cedecea neteri]|uniref:hypothetical protein n=1 Tax=Cedecea neteri TaxID=158822 RepID=UPI002AA957C5|nr:hypothetical protein [Cedecea neteri]WPU22592.1 hypothetical protein RI049_21590 [Cedecea neteri]
MKARAFNKAFPVGSYFIFKSCKSQFGGKSVKTVDVARDLKSATIVEIQVEPYFVNVDSLTPTG